MRPRDREEAARLDDVLSEYDRVVRPLDGIRDATRRRVFIEQLMESIHRVEYISRGILARDITLRRADPHCDLFDPLKAAALSSRDGDHDQACWLTFLFTHFGKHLRTGYQLIRDVYGRLGNRPVWTWQTISTNPDAFPTWLATNRATLENDGTPRYFGNHRKYLSLDPYSAGGTGQAFVSYVNWVLPFGSHRRLFEHAAAESGHDPRAAFNYLYRSMRQVASFGRTGRVDYLCMLAKLDLAEIEPGSTYMTGATGPLKGAKLLFGEIGADVAPRQLDNWLKELESILEVEMGMQILEDALCNWQKSPDAFIAFRG
jgi:hypothetical protein